jgi:uncharacterized protein YjbI with pentapeptide repeats
MSKKIHRTRFIKSSLREVTFAQADITGSSFDMCNLEGAIFNDTNLSSVDFSSAENYIIDPNLNTMKKAIFSAHGLEGLLYGYDLKII